MSIKAAWNRARVRGMALVVAATAVGCSLLSPVPPDPSRFYVLTAIAAAERADGDRASTLSLGVGPVRFPGYLDRQQLVTRVAPNRIVMSPSDRWAEPLKDNFVRVLAENLTALAGTDHVVVYPWYRTAEPRYAVAVDVMRFEAGPDGDANLVARWVVTELPGGRAVHMRESVLSRPAVEDDAAAALSAVVADLSREIADILRGLPG
jgi:hypothetical protein